MSADARPRSPGRLVGRHRECGRLDRLVEAVRAGESQVLVVYGVPGAGKTVLLDYLARRARGCRVVRVAGMQSEMEFAFAGIHQLCTPMLDHADSLPVPQQNALRTAIGLAAGPPPDRFLVGLAVLGLLSEAAADGPLIGVIDDEQWLDQASAQALGFVARRLGADPVGLVFASREPGPDLAGLPGLDVAGLGEQDARALLDSALTGPLDAQVRDLIVAETHGNPLALLQLPHGLSPAQLAGGFGLPGTVPLAGRIEESFTRQLADLPAETQRLLQLAAADPTGDRSLIWRAAGRLAIPVQAAALAEEAGLAAFAPGVRFRHPLIRSAAYQSAAIADRQELHAALAEVTDPIADPDRRAWHRAQAAPGPDEDVAAELEQSAERAQARGGLAAAAAFLERAVLLTADPARHAGRALAAARASMLAGAFGQAQQLLAMADRGGAGREDEHTSAQADLLRGQIAFASRASGDAPALLVTAARRLEPFDVALARRTYLEAWAAAFFAGLPAGPGCLLEVARAARSAPAPDGAPGPLDLLLDGLAVLVTDGLAAAESVLRQTAQVFAGDGVAVDDFLRYAWLATVATVILWDEDRWYAIQARQLRACREAGLLALLVINLNSMAQLLTWRGDLPGAASLIAEAAAIAAATGTRSVPYAALGLAGFRGSEAEATQLIDSAIADARAAGQEHGIRAALRCSAILHNGLGRYEIALAEAQQAADEKPMLHASTLVLPELIEAASRTGQTQLAAGALSRLAEATSISQTDWSQGTYARCRALLADGADAESWYREAVDRLNRTGSRPEAARAHLLYGEWLRRENRRTDAREQLRAAHGLFDTIGMEAFAERARRELLATGEMVRKRTAETRDQLTPQEDQITQLVRAGLSNAEIGAQLFLSTRTIEWHLRKVFIKLGISSRRQLHSALARPGQASLPA
jgi:DNA-binding CsgD family transcriptional regulator/tetratricopeptide (TPR) repeat protein